MLTSTTNVAHEITGSSKEHTMTAKSLGATSSPSRLQTPGECLSSWKEIASYLKRTVRTVQRWERHEGLPVHRHMHRHANSVYAHRSELDDWWNREVRSMEVEPIKSPCEGARRGFVSSQRVKANHSQKGLRQANPPLPEHLVECVLELTPASLSSSCDGRAYLLPALLVLIPIPGNLLGLEGRSTTRDAKAPCRSLSLAAS